MQNTKLEPVIFVIFGATGDLNWRKIIPALYNLYLDGWMPENFSIVGNGRTKYSDTDFRNKMLEGVNKFSRKGKAESESWKNFSEKIVYLDGDLNNSKCYKEINAKIKAVEKEWKQTPVIIYYLAVASKFFPVISQHLKNEKMTGEKDKTRLVIEKPFGRDLDSAKSLNNLLCNLFDENQIYRIDHYLGKETVQNILAFRFANSILEPIWNRNYIEHVQISVTEQLGVEGRASYYDDAGALRDMIQNHLLQLLCLIAMETPVSFQADEVRNRKVDVLRSIRRFKPEMLKKNAVRGQYGQGWIEGEKVIGYREEEGVKPQSNTETFAAIKFFIDNWRWDGVPFYVRTGKSMNQSSSIISIQFRDVPHKVFPDETIDNWRQNRLIISIQPQMSIQLQVQMKKPGLDMTLNTVDLAFHYDSISEKNTPEAYETLLLDTMTGDQTLFMRGDQVEAAWDLLMPVLNLWESKKSLDFPNYGAGSWGPELAEALIAQDGFHWFSTLSIN
ncbi:MAG: glucose-6-phosphate dehydrogenase [Saprospiraceae bacterium]|nr:glucose-6-phosphate dehydrogenase [Saprospiraceae bacterium]